MAGSDRKACGAAGPSRLLLRGILPGVFAAFLAARAAVPAAEADATQQTAPEALDFPAAVARALRNDPLLGSARHLRAAAARDAEAARGHLLPSLFLEESFSRTNVPAEAFALKIDEERLAPSDFADVSNFNRPAPVNDYVTSVTLSQPLFAPRAWLGYRAAARESQATALDLARRQEEAVHRVATAYLDVLTAKEFAAAAERSLEDAREHVRVAEALERAGRGLASDVLRARVFAARAEGAVVAARNRHRVAQQALALALGEKGGAAVDAAAPLPPFPPRGGLAERIERARRDRADLRAIALRTANAAAGVDLARSDYLPSVGLSAAYRLDAEDSPFSPDNRTWRVGVALQWNLFDGLRREAAVGRARAVESSARERARGAADLAAFEASRAYLAVEEAQTRAAIAGAALSAAEEAVRLVRARYENQLARLVDLLDAQSALDAARAEAVRAANDVLRAHADLEFATGSLLAWARGAPPAPGDEAGR